MTLKAPTFKACFHVEVASADKVILFDEQNRRYMLAGAPYVALVPYLSQKQWSTDQIVEKLEGSFSEAEIYYALLRLEEKGVLEEASKELVQPLKAFSNLLDVSIEEAARRLKNTAVSLHAVGPVSFKSFEVALQTLSLHVVEKGGVPIVVTDNYRHPEIREKFVQTQTPWILIKPVGAEVWIGPLFIPGKTACLDCLLEALRKNSHEERFVEKERGQNTPITVNKAELATTTALAYNLAANEIFKWVVQGENAALEGQILSYNVVQPSIAIHRVIRRPQCPTCGKPAPPEPRPLVLKGQKKQFVEDGGHRIVSPEETYQKYSHLISPITGILTHFKATLEEQPPHMYTYRVEHNASELDCQNYIVLENLRMTSGGKGKTEAQGKTSCLCEALERISAIFQGNEPRKKTSYKKIKEEAIHPSSILLFSNHQYAIRDTWNQTCSPSHKIPAPFDETKEIEWTPVWSLTEKRIQWIATGICYLAYPFSSSEEIFFTGGSNGNASGNTKEEAILQGFFELVERDSVALWWYSRLERPRVDLNTFPEPYIQRLIDSYASFGRELWAIDITMDLNIPTFVALSSTAGAHKGKILFGFGSHFDPKIALLRALTEMNQSFLYLSTNNLKNRAMRQWLDVATTSKLPYLAPNPNLPLKRYHDYIRLDTPDIKDDILVCQRIVESKGLQMLVLEQTRPEIGMPAVKVFVPGLRHFWNRYAPGRLYDIPLQLGLVKEKLKEEDLNPIPMFL